jgi:hypothetical protein
MGRLKMGKEVGSGPQQYAKAFANQVLAAMSGGLSVPFAIAALFLGESWQGTMMAALAALCFVFASYLVWKPERESVIALTAKLEVATPLPPSEETWVIRVRLIFWHARCVD